MITRIKICCIASSDEATTAIQSGASAIGLVSAMPSGPGIISETLIAEIAATIPPPTSSIMLTSHTEINRITEQQKACRVNTIQLCDDVTAEVHRQLKSALPGVSIVQVVHVRDESSIEAATKYAATADAILLDSGNTSLTVKELGGTGRVHDWALSASIVQAVEVPVFLAGGLDASNVADAIRQVQPFGVDVCSGVRTDGRLDERKLAKFVEQVANA